MGCLTIKMKFKICKRLETKGRKGREGKRRAGSRKERGWEGRREWKKRELGRMRRKRKEMPEGRMQSKKRSRQAALGRSKSPSSKTAFPRGGVACRDVTAPCRPRRPRPSVGKSPGGHAGGRRVGRPALPGWLRVPRPLAPGPGSPGGRRGRAVIAPRRGAYPGALCKAARAEPGAAALTLGSGPAGRPPPSSRGPSAAW